MAIPRVGYLSKACIICLFCAADLLINGYADHTPNTPLEDWSIYMFIGIQLLIQLLNFLMVFMLFFGTYLFQVGLIGVLVKEFRGVLYTIPFYGAVYIAYAACKLSLVTTGGYSQSELWDAPVFIFLSIAQKIGAMLYYLVMIRTTSRLGEVQWYIRGPWVAKFSVLPPSSAAIIGSSKMDGRS